MFSGWLFLVNYACQRTNVLYVFYFSTPVCAANLYNLIIIYTTIPLNVSACLPVALRKLQVTILTRSSRDISQTVRIDCYSFQSRVHISIRPSEFLYRRKTYKKTITKTESPREWSVGRQRPVETAIYIYI